MGFCMKKWLKLLLFTVCTLLVITLPISVALVWNAVTPSQYGDTYLGELSDKYERLKNTEGKKIVVIGGSATAFGLNSQLIDEEFEDYDVVNFGLYATIGTKMMLELSKVNIGEGDIIIFSPEMSEQAFSLYFDAETALQCLDSNWEMFKWLDDDDKNAMYGKFYSYLIDKSSYATGSKTMNLTGVYQHINFNDYGDIEYLERDENGELVYDDDGNTVSLRTSNKMASLYQSDTISFDTSYLTDEFIEYINDYAEYVYEQGASIYYTYSPMNSLALEDNYSSNLTRFQKALSEKLDFNIISNPNTYIMDPLYFYDSNYHLNDAGAIYRTKYLIDDMYRDVFHSDKTCDIEIPDPPEVEVEDTGEHEDSENADMFEYRETVLGLVITSVKEEYSTQTEITLPSYYQNTQIISVDEDAFSNCDSLTSIIVPETTNELRDGCFGNTASLVSIKLISSDPNNTSVSFDGGMLDNTRDDLKIYVPKDSISSYQQDYFWSAYSSRLVGY